MRRKNYGVYRFPYGIHRFPEERKSPFLAPIPLGILSGVALGTTIAAIVFSL